MLRMPWHVTRAILFQIKIVKNYMDLAVCFPVFGVSDQIMLKQLCSATDASYQLKFSHVASLDMILSNTRITRTLIRLRACAGWSAQLLFARQVFLHRGPGKGHF